MEAAAGVQVREGGVEVGEDLNSGAALQSRASQLADRLNIRSRIKSTPMEGWSQHWLGQRGLRYSRDGGRSSLKRESLPLRHFT